MFWEQLVDFDGSEGRLGPASDIRRTLTFAALMTCRPLPFPSEAPSMIPGKSSIWISAPPYSSTPGIAVSVVKEYAATAAFVFVILERNVDLPTDGKPTSAIRASPDFETSKPAPPPEPAPGPGSSNCARSRASLLYDEFRQRESHTIKQEGGAVCGFA